MAKARSPSHSSSILANPQTQLLCSEILSFTAGEAALNSNTNLFDFTKKEELKCAVCPLELWDCLGNGIALDHNLRITSAAQFSLYNLNPEMIILFSK